MGSRETIHNMALLLKGDHMNLIEEYTQRKMYAVNNCRNGNHPYDGSNIGWELSKIGEEIVADIEKLKKLLDEVDRITDQHT